MNSTEVTFDDSQFKVLIYLKLLYTPSHFPKQSCRLVWRWASSGPRALRLTPVSFIYTDQVWTCLT